ncbi:MAG: response regulator [Defluviitaleaceae bacterium]|nr:response regulator [Defluviitaleaceae bacterium]
MDKRKNTILILDDDPLFVTVLVELLKDDYTLFTARNGHNAINLAMNERPDLILMDVSMPEMTGYEVISALQYMNETKKIPTIFITHADTPQDEQQGLRLGAVDYIQKSLRAEDIKKRIDIQIEIINGARSL